MSHPTPDRRANRLIHESSPYLLQHAYNPVDWHPWGEEAISKARAEKKPIFLSIGYSSCHWCHVMERESFESEPIARILNENYVSIKVDREERPDLDDLYMQAVLMMNQGHGGWPMSVFLTPELKPFFGGTYFPPSDGPRGYGFDRILATLAEMFRREPDQIEASARQIAGAIVEADGDARAAKEARISREMLENATRELARRFDPVHGGFGAAPKFPPSMALQLLMREAKRTGDPSLLRMIETTLEKMSAGGIFDQLGGGFHRYSVDREWFAPHFEKMLYDNALMAAACFEATRLTHTLGHQGTGWEILEYIHRDMTDPLGGYYCAEDADSEGEEGMFYLWTREEIVEILGEKAGPSFCDLYGVTGPGNFEGKNILHVARSVQEVESERGRPGFIIGVESASSTEALFEAREKRVHPFKDTKILCAWNGMMISAMAIGAQLDSRGNEGEQGLNSARRAARFVLDRMRDGEGRLLRTWGRGAGSGEGSAKIPGFLDDYAFMITGLVDLYEADFDPAWLEEAERLADGMIARFFDAKAGGFFGTDGKDEFLLARRKDMHDGATPSGNSQAALGLLRLALFLDRPDYREAAMKTFAAAEAYLTRAPGAVHQLLNAVSFALDTPKEIAIIGERNHEATRKMLSAVWHNYVPTRALALAPPGQAAEGFRARILPLQDKTEIDGKPTAYVCLNRTCLAPVHTAEELKALLEK